MQRRIRTVIIDPYNIGSIVPVKVVPTKLLTYIEEDEARMRAQCIPTTVIEIV